MYEPQVGWASASPWLASGIPSPDHGVAGLELSRFVAVYQLAVTGSLVRPVKASLKTIAPLPALPSGRLPSASVTTGGASSLTIVPTALLLRVTPSAWSVGLASRALNGLDRPSRKVSLFS